PTNCGFRIAECGFDFSFRGSHGSNFGAGWSSPVARWAHNPKVAGSNPAPATNLRHCQLPISNCRFGVTSLALQSAIENWQSAMLIGGVAQLAEHRVCNAGVRGSNPLTSTMTLPICDSWIAD